MYKRYGFHMLNRILGFSKITDVLIENCLLIGGAYGDESSPIRNRVSCATVVEPGGKFLDEDKKVVQSMSYIKPSQSGDLSIPSNTIDLVTCLGSLHHIANVSFVMSEIYRCLAPGGRLLLREPIVSQGDFRFPRSGLTKFERGIPENILDDLVSSTGFTVVSREYCVFPPLAKLCSKLGTKLYNNYFVTYLDIILCKISALNSKYHRVNFFNKWAAASIYFVLSKPTVE